tara:strand:- start:63 stop:1034 length:972 start_codon:yes stop_codon:yes gene_type:complete
MKIDNKNTKIVPPKNQLQLFGYNNYFNSFIKLFHKDKLPNTILLSGPKGTGKATFVYHFINYLLSYREQNRYSVDNFTINPDNKSYKSLCNYTHPNFFLLENIAHEENIKIDSVRTILKFLNKTTYNSNIKIVMIDNAEYLNINSSNALLKVLEEHNNNTFFFIIHNSLNRILDTIKSRCIQFKFFFNITEKKKILENIIKQHEYNFNIDKIDNNFYFHSPGNILEYLKILSDNNIDYVNDKMSCISYLIEKYKQKKDSQLLIFISFLIELFYNELSFKNNKKLNIYFYNKFKIMRKIDDMKKFNLDKNNLFISLQGMLKNES